jgi:DNA-directed RNA polymerase specialized sigma24 family protein
MEEAVSLSLDLQAALPLLSETQRRRFLLCHEYGLKCEQIAVIEGCSTQAAAKAISTAKEQLKKYFSDEG